MKTRKLLRMLLSALLAISFILSGTGATYAQDENPPEQPPPPIDNGGLVYVDGRITAQDIQNAAKIAREKGYLPGLASADTSEITANKAAAMDPNNPPHYFGPFANYANSPMPKGPISHITIDEAGSGYTAPVVTIVDVYATGSGATAAATLSGGTITGISVLTPGVGYTAPLVVIEDPTGSDAAATAVLGPTLNGGIRKFVDSLPGLNAAGANNLGQYLPVAIPDTTTFPGADYYEIELGRYSEKLHSDLPATTLLGYRQTNTSDATVSQFHYLGPMIIAHKDRPVRIKFTNNLPANGDFFLPVDTTVMGAGLGPLDEMGMECDPLMPMPDMECQPYSQNRATVHLHGGFVPWISDGTPHQWTTPAGENTQYPNGVSVEYVPDMWFNNTTGAIIPGATNTPPPNASNNPGDGSLTFYYNNQQSARLMFYHDHAFGITRLNVYAGEAAPYLLTDQIEQDLMNGTNNSGVNPGLVQALPGYGIPLVIQDKTFVDATTIAAQDPTWRWGTGAIDPLTEEPAPKTGDLWMTSVYMPAQNPYDPTGASAFGRWQYGPYFWPPTSDITHGPVANEYYDPACDPAVTFCEPPLRPGVPSPSMGMEAFMDTPLVNGTAYPYLEVDPAVVRFRILNASDDRFVNLHFFVADPSVVTSDGRRNTEVKMVPALATPGFPATWSTDGRVGGVPDPATMGPDWIQIANEGGFLPAPAVIPPQPINWNMNATAFNFGNVTDHSLLLGTAERADVLVDFSQYAGQTLILYNDAPAAFPALDPRYDYYTDDPDLTSSGGAPTTQPGYGPNTRTIMQVRVKPANNPSGGSVTNVAVTNGGSGYSSMPIVDIFGGGGSGVAAIATGAVNNIAVTDPGVGITFTPIVQITGGGGTGATAVANVANGRIIGFQVTNGGSGYVSAPTVTITKPLGPNPIFMPIMMGGGGGVVPPVPIIAQGLATLRVDAITLTSGGSGYTTVPDVSLAGGGGSGATALASLSAGVGYDVAALEGIFMKTAVKPGVFETGQDRFIIPQAAYDTAYNATFPADTSAFVLQHEFEKSFYNGPLPGITVINPGSGYTAATVAITGGGGSGATAEAQITGGLVSGIILTNPGTGYTSAPTITITGDGTGATASAVPITITLEAKAIQDEMGEAFDDYGRMSGFLGLELPLTSSQTQNFILYPFLSPVTELVKASILTEPIGSLEDGTQIWKITHNGVDTHTIHVHLFNAQLVNRVAWDGAVIPPDANELGWRETIRVNPLEHTIIAIRTAMPTQPFDVPNSIRLIDPTRPNGVELMGPPLGFQDPEANPVTVLNHEINLGWEYVWHCHLLSHEEMDMMHSMAFGVPPNAPSELTAAISAAGVSLNWEDKSNNETAFMVMRADSPTGPWTTIGSVGANVTNYLDDTVVPGTYYYQIVASNVIGDTTLYAAPSIGFPNMAVNSTPSNIDSVSVPD